MGDISRKTRKFVFTRGPQGAACKLGYSAFVTYERLRFYVKKGGGGKGAGTVETILLCNSMTIMLPTLSTNDLMQNAFASIDLDLQLLDFLYQRFWFIQLNIMPSDSSSVVGTCSVNIRVYVHIPYEFCFTRGLNKNLLTEIKFCVRTSG